MRCRDESLVQEEEEDDYKKTMVSVHWARYLLLFQDFRCVFSLMHASDLLTGCSKSAVNIYFT